MCQRCGALTARGGARDWLVTTCVAFAMTGLSGSGLAQSASAPTPAAAADRVVNISEYQVFGNTVLKTIDIQRAVYPFVGPGHHVSDTEKARAALEKVYGDHGFQAVSVILPPQSVQGGVVKLQVIEARVGNVQIAGRRYSSPGEVTGGLTALTPGDVPNLKALNQQLAGANAQSADRQITPQLKPGSAEDTIDVDLNVQDKLPVHGGLELNNRYSPDTSPLRLQANLSYDDLWHLGHSLSALVDLAPENLNDAEVYALTYSAPIPGSDVRLSLTGLVSNSNVNTLGSTDVIGKGHSVTLNALVPLPSRGDYTQSLQMGVAYKDFTDVVSVTGQADAAPVTYYPINVTYNGSRRSDVDLLSLSAAVTFAFRGIGSDHAAFDAKRYDAQGNFIYAHASASYQHDLPLGANVYAQVDGQIANEPLISNEQFAAGGDGSVRGYLQSEALGDDAAHGSLEVRSPTLAPWIDKGKVVDDLRFLIFADAARTWLIDPLPGQIGGDDLASVGAGLRLKMLKILYGSLDVGEPLISSGSTIAYHPRIHFRVYTQF